MKIFIVAFTTLVAFCIAEAAEPEVTGPLFDTAWRYQNKLTGLQGEIDKSIQEVQTAVSGVLKSSTTETLHQFEDHIDTVIDEYTPHLEQFNLLIPGDCKNSAETILNSALEFTGFDASNCAQSYDNIVKSYISNANGALVRFDDVYSQVQMIVVKSFSGLNAFLTPEDIEQRITEVFELVEGKWNISKPEIEAVVTNLASAIAEQNINLGKCHDKIMIDAAFQFSWFGRMLQSCIEFNNAQSSADRLERTEAKSKATTPYKQLFEEYKAEFTKLKLYEWST